MVNPLDRSETPRATGLGLLDEIAVQQNVPANVLIALGERAGVQDENELAEFARVAAGHIAPRLQAGERIEDLIRAEAGDQADAFIARAREIGEARYPQQMEQARVAAEQVAEASRQEEPGILGDAARQVGAGFVSGVGSAVEGLGFVADQPLHYLRGDDDYTPGLLARAGRAGGDWLRESASDLRMSVSEETRRAIADSTPSGDLTDLSSISLGESPSLRGISMLAADVFGSFLPVVLASFAPGGALTAAGMGGAQGAGAGAESGRAVISEAFTQRGEDGRTLLEANSPLFQELRAGGMSEEQAFEVVRNEASRLSGLFGAGVASLGGAATSRIIHGGSRFLNRAAAGPLERALVTGATSGLEEGVQEAAETIAGRYGVQRASGMDVNLTEGTFGDFLLGALGGGPVGAVSGAIARAPSGDQREPLPVVGEDDELETGAGAVVSPDPVAPGGGGPLAADAGRDETRPAYASVQVRLRGERTPWVADIVGETEDAIEVVSLMGETFTIPRADIESGEVEINPAAAPVGNAGSAEAQGQTQAQATSPDPAPAFVQNEQQEAQQAPDSAPLSAQDARRYLDAIEERARRRGWDEEMTAAAAQLRDAIERDAPVDPAIAQSDVLTITKRDGAPFGDEAAARRALGRLGASAGGYDIVPTEGGYVARPRPPEPAAPGTVLDDTAAGDAGLAGGGAPVTGQGAGAGLPVQRGGDGRPATDPALAPVGTRDQGGVPDAAAPGEPSQALSEPALPAPARPLAGPVSTGEANVTDQGPWDFRTTYPAPDARRVDAGASQARGPRMDGPDAVVATLDTAMEGLQERLGVVAHWADRARRVAEGGRPDFQTPKGMSPVDYAKRHLNAAVREAEAHTAALGDVWGDEAVQAFASEAERRAQASYQEAQANPQALNAPAVPAALRQRAARPAAPSRVPLGQAVRRMGGIATTRIDARTGERAPTFMAQELAARDITPRTHPYLFNRQGGADFDNIAPGTFGPDDAQVFGLDETGNYLNREAIISRLADEVTGGPATAFDLAEDMDRRDEARAQIDQERDTERRQVAADAVESEVGGLGMTLLDAEISAIIEAVLSGADIADAIHDELVRSYLNEETTDAETDAGTGADDAEARALRDVPFGDEPLARDREDAPREAAGSRAPEEEPGEAGGRGQGRQDDREAGEGVTPADRPAPNRITGKTHKLVDRLSTRDRRTIEQYRDGTLGDLIGQIDDVVRRAESQMRAGGKDPDQFDERGRNRDTGQPDQLAMLIAEAAGIAEDLADEARRSKTSDIALPARDEDTGEYEDDGTPASNALAFLLNAEAQGINVDTISEADGSGDGDTTPMPDNQIFPPISGKTVTYTPLEKKGPFISQDEGDALVESWKARAKEIGESGVNRNKVVISLFDYTGAWSQPWEDAGYQVIRHDIKSGSDILTDARIFDRIEEYRQSGLEVFGVLSACPCTTFTGSGSRWWAERHDVESPEAVRQVFGERALWSGAKSPVEYNVMLYQATRDVVAAAAPTGFHALENPIGRIQEKTGIGAPAMRFHPSNYGDPYTKQTQLFGVMNTDLPMANVRATDGSKMQSKLRGSDPLGKEARSATPTGFSYAFFMANDPTARGEAAPVASEATEAGEQTVVPGAERDEAQAKQRTSERQKAEIAARQQQSKMRRLDGNSGDAGPLFGGQGDLFSAPSQPGNGSVAAAAQDTATDPTPAQAEAENYKTGKAQWNGLTLSIENAKGSIRRKVGPTGEEWSVTMPAHYGRILRTEGADGDHVDFYMGPNEASDFVVVVNQIDPATGAFDEHKVVLGTGSRAEALRIYQEGFSDGSGKSRIGSDTATSVDGFKAWLASGDLTMPTQPVRQEGKEKSHPSTTNDKITDFGEKIGGARKDKWGAFADRMREAANFDIAAEPLSKTWPEPNYDALIEEGTDPWAVAFVRAAREEVPRKPSSNWKRSGWVANVEILRGFAQKVLAGELDREAVDGAMMRREMLARVRGKTALYQAYGHAKSLKELTFQRSHYSVRNGQHRKEGWDFWEVTLPRKASAFNNFPRVLVSEDTMEAAIKAFGPVHAAMDASGQTKDKAKADRQSKFKIWSMPRKADQGYFIGVKVGANHIALRSGVMDVKEARRIVNEEADTLQEQLDRLRDIPSERRDQNAPRIGVDRRSGGDVTPEAFQEAFGFRGVEFGNYVEGPRRQQDLNEAYDALHDLAGVLDVPTRALSLNGTLGLAFGARGKGGKNSAAAHYEPGKIVINLTKTNGKGSLAHEWFHAVDNYFARKRTPMRGTYITDNSSPGGAFVEGIRPEVVDAFRAVRAAIAKTDLRKRSDNIDRTRSKPYWGTGIEMHARAFESYVIAKLQDQGGANDYLVNVVDGMAWGIQAELSGLGDSFPYLTAKEVEIVRPAFDALFETIDTRETDAGLELYSRFGEDADPTKQDIELIARDVAAEMRRSGLDSTVSAEVVSSIHGAAYGSYLPGAGAIRVKGGNRLDTLGTLRHEIVHALRDATLWGRSHGLFTQAEWQGLVRAARDDRALMGQVQELYPDLGARAQMEEAVAELYRRWAARRDQRSGIDRALQKVRAFFQALANALRGRGFQSAALTMERIAGGGIGGRGPRGGSTAPVSPSMVPAESRFAPRRGDGRFASKAAELSARLLGGGAITAARERNFLSQMLTDAMGGKSSRYNILSLVPGEPLYEELAKDLPSARTYLKLKHAMSAMRNKRQAEAATVMDDWRGFLMRNRKANDALMDLMHEATIAELDPAKPFVPRKKQSGETDTQYEAYVEGRRREHSILVAKWEKLPKAAQDIYVKVRDAYVEVSNTERDIIEQNVSDAMDINLKRARLAYEDELNRIDEDGLEGAEREEAEEAAADTFLKVKKRAGYGRASRLRSLRLMLEQSRVQGPYFPLLRHGQYFVTVKDEAGKVVAFTKTETARKQAEAVADAKKAYPGHEVVTGLMGASEAAPDVDPMFVADVEQLIGDKVEDADLMDSIWQRYLETLPDFSMRKSHMHRQGVPGYSKDAFRNYARQMFHSAHQLARLAHGMKMQMALEDVAREARRAPDPNRAGAVSNEMAMRHQWIMNPQSSAWSTWATGAAFVYYLGMTPAAALVNLSQTVVVGIPVLAAASKKGGVARASRELMRGLREFGAGRGAVEKAKSLTDDERAAMREAYDRGIVDKSQAHDLAGVSESGVEYSDVRARIMKPISFFFHHAERLNREITFLAAYRMARADGIDHDKAIDKAGSLTWKSHFNYESDSRPRVQQSDFMRVLTVFRNFQLNMLYRLFRDIHQSFKGATEADRKEARAQLFGITGMMMMSAGVTGTWGYSLLMTLAGMFTPGGDADDLEKEVKNALVNLLGRDVAGLVLNGVPGHLTGIDLSSRLGMPELWFRSPNRQLEGDDLYNYWAQQFLGAVPGMAQNIVRGVDLAAGGDVWRGTETAVPKFIRDLMRGLRYSQDGVTTVSGNPILEALPAREAIIQALGFTPAAVSEAYERNSWMRNENAQIQDARGRVFNAIWADVQGGGEISQRSLSLIQAFNQENPDYQIDSASIRRSIQARRRGAADTVGGVRLNNRIEGRIRENAPVSIYGDSQ